MKIIAFPSISTGVYGYPIEKASDIAIRAVLGFLEETHQMEEIIFVLFSENDYEVYEKKMKKINFRKK